MQKQVPLYLHSFETAQKNGKKELEQYIASYRNNVLCAKDIENSINSHFDGLYYPAGFEEDILKSYGIDRVKYIVSYNIQQHLYDKRISNENKTWALQIQKNQTDCNYKLEYLIHTHIGLMNLFVNHIRQIEQQHSYDSDVNM